LLKRKRNATTRGVVLTDCPKRRRNIFLYIAPKEGACSLLQEEENNVLQNVQREGGK
jgi:hypothetical protein